LASSQSWLPLLRPSIPIGWRLHKRQPIGMLGRSSGNHDWLLANASACASCGFRLYNARNASNAFEWKPGFSLSRVTLAVKMGAQEDSSSSVP